MHNRTTLSPSPLLPLRSYQSLPGASGSDLLRVNTLNHLVRLVFAGI